MTSLKQNLLPIAFLSICSISYAESVTSISTGIDYSSGKYGESERTETLYIPVGIKYENAEWTLRAIVPYVQANGPSNALGQGPDRVTLNTGQNTRRNVAGLGDIVLTASWTALQQEHWLVDLGTKIKLATASEQDGLGTGKNDYALQTEVYRSIDKHTLFGTLGIKKMGDPDGVSLKDPIYASLGWSVRTSGQTSLGLSYDYRQKIQENGAPIRESSVFLNHKLDKNWKIQSYLVCGHSKASPDLGGGVFLHHAY